MTEVNITRTPWTTVSVSHYRYHPSKRRTTVSYQNPTLQTPSSPKPPGTDVGEDPHHQKPREITVEDTHESLLPPHDETDDDAPITHRLIGAYYYDTCIHLYPYTPYRRCRGMGRGKPLTDPSPGTIPSICSPFPPWCRVDHLPSDSPSIYSFFLKIQID